MTQTLTKMALAQMGFIVVPQVVKHGQHGHGFLHFEQTGARFVPFDKQYPETTIPYKEEKNESEKA